MKPHEFDRIVRKFGMQTRQGGDLLAWFDYEGRTVIRTKRSRGTKELPIRLIRNQLRLTPAQLRAAIRCTLGLDDYLAILRGKGLI